MVKVGIGESDIGGDVIDADLAEEQAAIIPNAKSISSPAVDNKHRGSSSMIDYNVRIAAPHPALDREVLQLQIGGTADNHGIAAAVEDKGLPDSAGAERDVSSQRSMVVITSIEGIALSRPP